MQPGTVSLQQPGTTYQFCACALPANVVNISFSLVVLTLSSFYLFAIYVIVYTCEKCYVCLHLSAHGSVV